MRKRVSLLNPLELQREQSSKELSINSIRHTKQSGPLGYGVCPNCDVLGTGLRGTRGSTVTLSCR